MIRLDSNINTTLYIGQLEEDSLWNFKQKMAANIDLIVDKKAHPATAGLLRVLFEEPILKTLSAKQLIHICDSIFPSSAIEKGWIVKYADMLVRVIGDSTSTIKAFQSSRAVKYDEYLREVLIPDLKKGAQSKDVLDDLDHLVNLYKVTACLLRYKRDRVRGFVFEVNWEDMECLNDAIQNIKGAGSNVFGIPLDPIRTEDKQYAALMGWILEELLCKQDAVKSGGEH